jgi:hypothetical protein
MTATNTTDSKTAAALAEISGVGQGTLVSYRGQKKGVTRGKKHAKVVYGDDEVHVLIWTGFSYESFIERSLKKLLELEDQGNLITTLLTEVQSTGVGAVVHDICAAIQETKESFKRALDPESVPPSNRLDSQDVFEPLVVDGVKVPGSKVYTGKGDDTNPRAPKPGTVYIDGVKLGEKILLPATNGHWQTKSKAKTVAKNILRRKLPAGLYVRYALEPERVQALLVGDAAADAAKADGVPVNPSAIKSLFKIAP